ncbi:hypothetical protein P154DRAFT_592475 [Amniculicola lignicola CBS 123094]|uniref:Septin-type G domain-containing protein n=1 Tax=Amniculicola lignicola CBS 123094 TaxID=1392246 RepID=A0A6A5X2I9_9PLEO|nr:hypothetical protein P154DRAFT_592475 [Amniculicola lignicola CBS 123094]
MRPSSGGDVLPSARPRSRKSSVADASAPNHGPASHVPTTFFLRSESEMEQSVSSSQGTESTSRLRGSNYGVQSLADTLEAAFGQEGSEGDKKESPRLASHGSPRLSRRPSESSKSSPKRTHRRKPSNPALSAPLTPLNTESPSPYPTSAVPSTPKSVSVHSLKLSDEESNVDESSSQAIASSGDEEEEPASRGEAGVSFPQLVMPSLQMPTRRPFTTKGKAMGKLKVLVAGEAGLGKTSLIRSIVQLCEDIVHVDPLSPSSSFSHPTPAPKAKSRLSRRASMGTTRIMEIHASTKTLPPWYTDLDESRTQRRRKSMGDGVLERNLCFIDTPGYGKGVSKQEDTGLIVDFVESLLYQTASVTSMDDSDVTSLVSGRGGVQVDLVFYLLSPAHDISKDIEFMQQLSSLTNVIPVIAKSDTLSAAEVIAVKTSILARLQSTPVKPFLFGKALDEALLIVQGLSVASPSSGGSGTEPKEYPFHIATFPYAISSSPGPDTETMDASLLMSPDYVQPLLPSELTSLVTQVFDPESIAWLRHSAAKKFLAWRHRTKLPSDSFILQGGLAQRSRQRGSISASSVGLNGAAMNASSASSIFSAASPSGVLVPRSTSPFYLSNSPFPGSASSPSLSHTHIESLEGPAENLSLARWNSYASGEQRLAEVRLARWATDLQRSLRNEKDRFEELQRDERAKWLLERVGEEVRQGNIVPSPTTGSPRAEWAIIKHGNESKQGCYGNGSRYGGAGKLDSRDPLGLCELGDEFRKRGIVLVKVLGGMSVLGAVVVAVVRACGFEMGVEEGGMGWWRWATGVRE